MADGYDRLSPSRTSVAMNKYEKTTQSAQPKRTIAMADPDPRHHADPMNPGLQALGEDLDHVEQDSAIASSRQYAVSDGNPSSSGEASGPPDSVDRNESDEDSPGEALAREDRGEPMDDIPEPNEPA
jgi:hypothetical protein